MSFSTLLLRSHVDQTSRLAKRVVSADDGSPPHPLTHSGAVPERREHGHLKRCWAAPRPLRPRHDVYSPGVIFTNCSLAETPFQAANGPCTPGCSSLNRIGPSAFCSIRTSLPVSGFDHV